MFCSICRTISERIKTLPEKIFWTVIYTTPSSLFLPLFRSVGRCWGGGGSCLVCRFVLHESSGFPKSKRAPHRVSGGGPFIFLVGLLSYFDIAVDYNAALADSSSSLIQEDEMFPFKSWYNCWGIVKPRIAAGPGCASGLSAALACNSLSLKFNICLQNPFTACNPAVSGGTIIPQVQQIRGEPILRSVQLALTIISPSHGTAFTEVQDQLLVGH